MDLDSIRITKFSNLVMRECILNSVDIDKLNLIDNATDGSTAFCVDTGQLYILHQNEWKEVKLNE